MLGKLPCFATQGRNQPDLLGGRLAFRVFWGSLLLFLVFLLVCSGFGGGSGFAPASRSVMNASQRPSGDHSALALDLLPRVNWNTRPVAMSASQRWETYSFCCQSAS